MISHVTLYLRIQEGGHQLIKSLKIVTKFIANNCQKLHS